MKTIFSRLILALVFLLATSATSAEETDLKELRYTYENHLTTNDSVSEYLFHLEYPMILTVNHAGSPADSTSLRLWEKKEGEAEYTLITEVNDHSRAFGTAHLWNRTGAPGRVRGDTLALKKAQAFFCRSLPSGLYKLTSLRRGERVSTSCLPELITNIYAQAISASQAAPIIVPLNRGGVSCWNAPYRKDCTLYYQLSVECNQTIDIETYDAGKSTLILKDAKGVTIAQSADNKIAQQALTPGNYSVIMTVEEGHCMAGLKITSIDEIGNTIERPIPLNIRGNSYIRTNISKLADTCGEKEKDIFYSFNLDTYSLCIFNFYYSSQAEQSQVFMTLLNERREVVAKIPSHLYSVQLHRELEPGMYYLFCEGGLGLVGDLVIDALIRPKP